MIHGSDALASPIWGHIGCSALHEADVIQLKQWSHRMKLISMRQDILPILHLEQHGQGLAKTTMRNVIVCLTTRDIQTANQRQTFAARQIFMGVTA